MQRKRTQHKAATASATTTVSTIEPFVCAVCGLRTHEMLKKLFHRCRSVPAVAAARTTGGHTR
jgi:hypothetical protein